MEEIGSIFDVYQDGKPTFRGLQTEKGVVDLNTLLFDNKLRRVEVDSKNEVTEILIDNILKY